MAPRPIIEQLFLIHEPQTSRDIPRNPDVEPVSISADELQKAADHLKLGKAPDPDGIPIKAIKAAVKAYTEAFLSVFQNCFDTVFFRYPGSDKNSFFNQSLGSPPATH